MQQHENNPPAGEQRPRQADINNNCTSRPQCGNDPGTTKLLDSHDGPPGQKCPRGRCVLKGRGSKSRAGFGNSCTASMQGPVCGSSGSTVAGASPLSAKMCRDKSWRSSGGGGEEHFTGQEAERRCCCGTVRGRTHGRGGTGTNETWNYGKFADTERGR